MQFLVEFCFSYHFIRYAAEEHARFHPPQISIDASAHTLNQNLREK